MSLNNIAKMRTLLCFSFFLLASWQAKGQGSVLMNEGLNFEILDRFEIKTGTQPIYFSNLRPINRGDVVCACVDVCKRATYHHTGQDKIRVLDNT